MRTKPRIRSMIAPKPTDILEISATSEATQAKIMIAATNAIADKTMFAIDINLFSLITLKSASKFKTESITSNDATIIAIITSAYAVISVSVAPRPLRSKPPIEIPNFDYT